MTVRHILLLLFLPFLIQGQNFECLGFYNLENLFDIENDTLINDEEYLPENGWTEERYKEKLDNMAKVIDLLGKEKIGKGPSFLGVSEIENKKVLEDLVAHPLLADENYQILHFNSPDRRGIDVAALYQKDRFTPLAVKMHPVLLYDDDGERKFTRDIMHVQGLMGTSMVHITINHWPSRRGGEKASRPFREAAAKVNKAIFDSLRAQNPNVNFIVMGDLNDNPNNHSVSKILGAKKNFPKEASQMFNPFCKYYKKGIGSNAWDDTWSNFDQIILSPAFDKASGGTWAFEKAQIFKKPFMLQSSGRFQGYPLRTQAGGQYLGGYSDHFPVLVYLKSQ